MTRESDIDPVSADNLAQMHADGKPNADDRAYLQTRCDVANNAGARLFISIHVNSAPIESARGTTFYWYKPQDAPFAQAIEKSVIPRRRDVRRRHAPRELLRRAPHDDARRADRNRVRRRIPATSRCCAQPSFLQNIAQGIANGVKAYAGVAERRTR